MFLDEKLSTGQAGNARLFIHLTNGAVTLALKENATGKFLAAESILSDNKDLNSPVAQLRHALAQSEIMRLEQHTACSVAVANAFHTLVPAGLYHPGDEQQLLRFAVSRTDLEAGADTAAGWGVKVIYGIQPELKSYLLQSIPSAHICHAITCNLEYQSLTAARNRGPMMQLTCHPELLTVTVSDGKKLMFSNSFVLRDQGEAAYFTLFVCEQLDLDASNLQVELNGTVHCCDVLRTRLEPYCSNLSGPSGMFSNALSYKLKAAQPAGLLPALTISLCES